MRRYAAHLAVALLVITTLIELPDVAVSAAPPAPSPSHALPDAAIGPRGTESTRLPEAIPWGSPLATPLPTPIMWGSPLPAPSYTEVIEVRWPVAGTITTYYSAAHLAIDIAAPCGTPVVAPLGGDVVFATWKSNGGGLVVDISTAIGVVSLNHLSGVAVGLGPIAQGATVGYVGTTGNSTGCHVHWALWNNGWRNPL